MNSVKTFSEVIIALCNWITKHKIKFDDCRTDINANFKVETAEPKGNDIISLLVPWGLVDSNDIIDAAFEVYDYSSELGFACVFDNDNCAWWIMNFKNPIK